MTVPSFVTPGREDRSKYVLKIIDSVKGRPRETKRVPISKREWTEDIGNENVHGKNC